MRQRTSASQQFPQLVWGNTGLSKQAAQSTAIQLTMVGDGQCRGWLGAIENEVAALLPIQREPEFPGAAIRVRKGLAACSHAHHVRLEVLVRDWLAACSHRVDPALNGLFDIGDCCGLRCPLADTARQGGALNHPLTVLAGIQDYYTHDTPPHLHMILPACGRHGTILLSCCFVTLSLCYLVTTPEPTDTAVAAPGCVASPESPRSPD